MTLQRWDPFRELRSVEDTMDRMWRDFFRPRVTARIMGDGGEMAFPVDVYQTQDHYVIRASLPGVKPDNVEISMTGSHLTLKGHTEQEREVNEEQYLLRERRSGQFSRSFQLPEGVDPDKAEASFEHGELTIRVPKREELKPRTLKVNVNR